MVVQLSKNIDTGLTEFVKLCKKTVHFGTNTIANEFQTKPVYPSCTAFSLLVKLFNGCTGF